MKRALFLSLAIHLLVLGLLFWCWPAPVRPSARALAVRLPAPETPFSRADRPGAAAKPSLAPQEPGEGPPQPVGAGSDRPETASASSLGASNPNQQSSPQSGPASEDLVVDAMTSGESFENPVLLGYPNPNYPRTARRQGWEGAAEIEVTVDESGKGIEVFLLRSSGHSELDKSALDALRQARFQPGTRNGIPETGTMTVTIRFRLE